MYTSLVPLVVSIMAGCIEMIFFGNYSDVYKIGVNVLSQLLPYPYNERPIIVSPMPDSNNSEYDFIIVGSGSAGSVIANRLSEIGKWNILLLEIGYEENTVAQYPLLASLLQFSEYNWAYTTEPQENACRAMEKQRCAWPRGKALGGSSVINYMIYTRGNPLDYDRWAELGNPGWSYDDVLPYFLKSEDSHLRSSNKAYHSKGGYQTVGDPFESDLTAAFLRASQEQGYQLVDYNSPDYLGFSRIQATMKLGRRNSAAQAFLKPILRRKNLHILTGARVTKILINSLSRTAYGVRYDQKDRMYSITAKKEVIICAGALNSPQLLMLSGIGPKAHLQELQISSLSDLPVGQTLYDHVTFAGLVFNINTTIEPISSLFNLTQLLGWYNTGVGPLSSLAGLEALGYIQTNVSREKENYPDVEILFSGAGAITADYGLLTRRTLKITDEYYYNMYASISGTPTFAMHPMLLHPKSKGYMKLKSANPYDTPLFYGNYLTDPDGHDVKTLTAAIRIVIQISQKEAFKKYKTHLNSKPFVGCQHLLYHSDDYWKCALQYLTTTVHHQTSTCKMGPVDDTTAVVDHTLKVHGIKRLRVADSSVIPITLSAHTHAPSVMIGEYASDLIKQEWVVL